MKSSFIISLTLFQQLSFAQVQVQNNYKTARTNFAVQKLEAAINQLKLGKVKYTIRIDIAGNGRKESYSISAAKNIITITGNDESGILYGCLELADRIKIAKSFPFTLS